MTRRALLVGNAVTYSDLSKSITRPIIERTVRRLGTLLENLDPQYAFDITYCLNERGQSVVGKLESLARRAAQDRDLFLFYYFGHGDLSEDLKLRLLHKGAKKGDYDYVGLEQLETRIAETGAPKSIFLLDCCYAGSMKQSFTHNLRGDHCRIAATEPSFKAWVTSGTLEDPIGSFTSALLESFTTPDACVSNADDRVTAASLFEYLRAALANSEAGRSQIPTMMGSLRETLFEYRSAPSLRPGYSHSADEKTAYAKIVVICRALTEGNFQNILSLHRHLVKKYSSSFETLYKQQDGTFTYVPVNHRVVARYLGFMQRIGLLQKGEIKLSPHGKLLATNWERRCNELLLAAVDSYLSERGMSRDKLTNATQRVLRNRRIPTKDEVADVLSLTGYRLTKSDVGILLDLLAYSGVLRVADRRAYFPWN